MYENHIDSKLPEPVNEAYDVFKQRLKHPIFGGYAISFAIWNWSKLIHIFFIKNSQNLDNDINEIIGKFDTWDYVWPIIFTAAYIIITPFLQYLLFRWRLKIYEWQEEASIYKEEEIDKKRRKILESKAIIQQLLENESLSNSIYLQTRQLDDLKNSSINIGNNFENLKLTVGQLINKYSELSRVLNSTPGFGIETAEEFAAARNQLKSVLKTINDGVDLFSECRSSLK